MPSLFEERTDGRNVGGGGVVLQASIGQKNTRNMNLTPSLFVPGSSR